MRLRITTKRYEIYTCVDVFSRRVLGSRMKSNVWECYVYMSLSTAVIYFKRNKIDSPKLNTVKQNRNMVLRTRVGKIHQSFNKNSIFMIYFSFREWDRITQRPAKVGRASIAVSYRPVSRWGKEKIEFNKIVTLSEYMTKI